MASADLLLRDKLHVPREFNRIAHRYDLATFLSQGYAGDLQLSVRRMALRGDEYLADLCCGTGKSTAACIEELPGGKVLGIDFSAEMLRHAVINVLPRYAPEQLEFRNQNVMTLDYPDHTFDAIFMAYGIRNMPDYFTCLKNLQRMLKPGGIIAFHEYSLSRSLFIRLYWYILGYLLIIPLSTLVTGSSRIFRYLVKSVPAFPAPAEFKALLAETGYTEIRSMPLPGWRRPILHTFVARKAPSGNG